MRTFRLGTIGTGIIVRNVLDQALNVEGLALGAVYSRSEERGRALAERYGCHTAHTDIDAFFSDPGIDCVYIALPNALHYAYAKRALASGKSDEGREDKQEEAGSHAAFTHGSPPFSGSRGP